MKGILHSLLIIDAVWAFLPLVACLTCTVRAGDIAYGSLDAGAKQCVVADIVEVGGDCEFVVAYESGLGYRWYRDKTFLPLAASFGLAQANVIISSDTCEIKMTNGLSRCYVYAAAERLGRDLNGPKGYGLRSATVFDDGVCRFVLVKPQKDPIQSRFRPFRARSRLATPALIDGTSVWDYEIRPGVKVVNRRQFLSVFSNNVYKVSGGMFAVEMDVAVKVVEHDFRRGFQSSETERRVARTPRFGDIIVLNGREISEVVYWLWRRKAKPDEYAHFVKAHPELFEPIADVSEFKTELGRRLLDARK